ncbi:MAG: TIGR04282 family arsenosugar biosynthesis glycosyltransferase [Elusimicrobia bacterium]|nr:TIGR04282 family arsenosugar biosynthesis glycosyltransferase [Elusimicrobiota bacterium]
MVDRRPLLLVFLKAPAPGRVKTRLAAGIGARAAARAHVALSRATRDALAAARGLRVVWVYAAAPRFRDLAWLGRPPGEVWPQGKGDLGTRLEAAFARAFARGAPAALAIGADCPELGARRLEAAAAALRAAEVVVCPAEDGGYALIGLRAPRPALFRAIPWSSPRTLAATLARARSLGLSVRRLERVSDVDRPADLAAWLLRVSA